MTLEEFRAEMDAYWQSVNEEADALKDSYVALERLRALYGKLDAAERDMADQVISAWLLEDHEGRQWDALVLVTDLAITAAIPALDTLSDRLATSTAPDAAQLAARVRKKINELAAVREG